MVKKQINVHISDSVEARLDHIADYHNQMSKNTLLAIVASEISRLEPQDLWMGLARLTQGTKPLAPEPKPTRTRKPKTEHAHTTAAAA